jgi:hypothetical protein
MENEGATEEAALAVSTVAADDASSLGQAPDEEAQGVVAPSAVTKDPPSPVLQAVKGTLPRLSSTLIDINQLSPEVAETLRPFDLNGDGKISVTELVHGAMTQVEQEEKVSGKGY